MSRLALLGGEPIRRQPFPPSSSIGEEEKREVLDVLGSGLLSGFAARPEADFYGGPKVLALEDAFCTMFGVSHAVAFNSATSALHACAAAAGLGPGDEAITSPYTMTASASCAVMQRATPVFVDVEPDTFCLDPKEVERAVTSRTKAIIAVNLFGQPAALDSIFAVANRHRLTVIEDNAQAPGALYRGRYAGTVGQMGVFSLNRHKTIQCGEGGVAVTNDPALARRLQLVRNHGEAVAEDLGWSEDAMIVGYNYRMTELQAAVALAQSRKLHHLNQHRVELSGLLSQSLAGCEQMSPPKTRDGCSHVYYLYALKMRFESLGIPRGLFLDALKAEGIPMQGGYVKPLYRLPLFRLPKEQWSAFPVTEALYTNELITTNVCRFPTAADDIKDVASALEKLLTHVDELRQLARKKESSPVMPSGVV